MMRPQTPPRSANWPEAMHAFLHARQNKPFAWGTNDCCTIIADWFQAQRGADPIAAWRGKYANEAEGDAILAPVGTLADFLGHALTAAGAVECPPNYAQRGDLAVVRLGNQLLAGVVIGTRVAVPGIEGIQHVPTTMIQRAWAV